MAACTAKAARATKTPPVAAELLGDASVTGGASNVRRAAAEPTTPPTVTAASTPPPLPASRAEHSADVADVQLVVAHRDPPSAAVAVASAPPSSARSSRPPSAMPVGVAAAGRLNGEADVRTGASHETAKMPVPEMLPSVTAEVVPAVGSGAARHSTTVPLSHAAVLHEAAPTQSWRMYIYGLYSYGLYNYWPI